MHAVASGLVHCNAGTPRRGLKALSISRALVAASSVAAVAVVACTSHLMPTRRPAGCVIQRASSGFKHRSQPAAGTPSPFPCAARRPECTSLQRASECLGLACRSAGARALGCSRLGDGRLPCLQPARCALCMRVQLLGLQRSCGAPSSGRAMPAACGLVQRPAAAGSADALELRSMRRWQRRAVPGDRCHRPLAAAATAAACRRRLCCPGSRIQRVPPVCSLPSRVCSQLAQQRQRLQAAGSNGRPHSHAAARGGENVRGVRPLLHLMLISLLCGFPVVLGLLLLHIWSCGPYRQSGGGCWIASVGNRPPLYSRRNIGCVAEHCVNLCRCFAICKSCLNSMPSIWCAVFPICRALPPAKHVMLRLLLRSGLSAVIVCACLPVLSLLAGSRAASPLATLIWRM